MQSDKLFGTTNYVERQLIQKGKLCGATNHAYQSTHYATEKILPAYFFRAVFTTNDTKRKII